MFDPCCWGRWARTGWRAWLRARRSPPRWPAWASPRSPTTTSSTSWSRPRTRPLLRGRGAGGAGLDRPPRRRRDRPGLRAGGGRARGVAGVAERRAGPGQGDGLRRSPGRSHPRTDRRHLHGRAAGGRKAHPMADRRADQAPDPGPRPRLLRTPLPQGGPRPEGHRVPRRTRCSRDHRVRAPRRRLGRGIGTSGRTGPRRAAGRTPRHPRPTPRGRVPRVVGRIAAQPVPGRDHHHPPGRGPPPAGPTRTLPATTPSAGPPPATTSDRPAVTTTYSRPTATGTSISPNPARSVWTSPLGRTYPVTPETILPPAPESLVREPDPDHGRPADPTERPLALRPRRRAPPLPPRPTTPRVRHEWNADPAQGQTPF